MFNINYRNFNHEIKPKMVSQPSYLHNGNPRICKKGLYIEAGHRPLNNCKGGNGASLRPIYVYVSVGEKRMAFPTASPECLTRFHNFKQNM